MGNIGADSPQTIKALAQLLSEDDESVLLAALTSLTSMGTKASESGEAITERLTHQRADLRAAAVKCLAKIEPDAAKSVPLLLFVQEIPWQDICLLKQKNQIRGSSGPETEGVQSQKPSGTLLALGRSGRRP